MSNVLIGIIGVILFIGLALAGALFLGPRFQESTQNSKASASVQALSQITNAINAYELQEGAKLGNNSVSDLTPGYLKTVPSPQFWDGTPTIANGVSARLLYVTMSEDSRSVCSAINRQIRSTSEIPVVLNWQSPTDGAIGTTGCYDTGTPNNILVLWSKV